MAKNDLVTVSSENRKSLPWYSCRSKCILVANVTENIGRLRPERLPMAKMEVSVSLCTDGWYTQTG
jgi:hypothetical protein